MKFEPRLKGKIQISVPMNVRIGALKATPARAGAARGKRAGGTKPAALLPEALAVLKKQGLQIADDFELAQDEQRPAIMARASSAPMPATIDVDLAPDEQAVVLTEQDGVLRWHFPSKSADGRAGAGKGSATRSRFVIPLTGSTTPDGARASFSLSGIFSPIKTYVLRVAAGKLVDFTMDRLERDIIEGPVVVADADPATWLPLKGPFRPILPEDRAPTILLFVHGTFSSTRGSFGGLAGHAQGQKFLQGALARYDLILGFDHKTLCKTPEQNAEDMLKSLSFLRKSKHPPVIHAIAYSRGGLVLRSLTELLWDKTCPSVRFERAVAVACTNAGTYLGSPKNWNELVDVYTNIAGAGLGAVGGLTGTIAATTIAIEIIGGVGSLVKHIVGSAVKDQKVPGLAAMDPSGPFIQSINKKEVLSPDVEGLKWYAVTGDFEPTASEGKLLPKVARWLADGVVDRLMGNAANDLVVHTSSMTEIDPERGLEFEGCLPFLRSEGVYHTVYFDQPKTASFLGASLGLSGFEREFSGMKAAASGARSLDELTKRAALPDRVDLRDFEYKPTLRPLPNALVNIDRVPAILDQGQEGACTGFALAAAINYLHAQGHNRVRRVSPFMLYDLARKYDEWPGEQYEGSSARGTMKGWVAHGACQSDLWKTSGRPFTQRAAIDALQSPGGAYYRVNHRDIRDMHAALNETGILFATIMVHAGWQNPETLYPVEYSDNDNVTKREIALIVRTGPAASGHAVAIVGYTRDGFIIQNSWGVDWGTGGFALLPYEDYLLHAMDVWVAQLGVPVQMNLLGELSAQRSDTGDESVNTRGLSRATEQIPLAIIRPYIVDIGNNGKLSPSGKYWTTEADLQELFERTMPDTIAAWSKTRKRRILLFLHGGLNGEVAVARRVVAFRDTLLKNEIYPLHIMWETGATETLQSIIADQFTQEDERAGSVMDQFNKLRGNLADMRHRAMEMTLSKPGTSMWSEMKENALLASSVRDGGMRLLAAKAAAKLDQIRQSEGEKALANWEIHVVGHSAGSIFAAHALPFILALGMKVKTLQFFAPAITTELFRDTLLPMIKEKQCPKPLLYLLPDEVERADHVGPVYGRSLLYLVSNAFEDRYGMPLLGMQKFAVGDAVPPYLQGLYGPAGKDPNLIIAGQTKDVATKYKTINGEEKIVVEKTLLSESTSHGGFDNDAATLNAMLKQICGTDGVLQPFHPRDLAYD